MNLRIELDVDESLSSGDCGSEPVLEGGEGLLTGFENPLENLAPILNPFIGFLSGEIGIDPWLNFNSLRKLECSVSNVSIKTLAWQERAAPQVSGERERESLTTLQDYQQLQSIIWSFSSAGIKKQQKTERGCEPENPGLINRGRLAQSKKELIHKEDYIRGETTG